MRQFTKDLLLGAAVALGLLATARISLLSGAVRSFYASMDRLTPHVTLIGPIDRLMQFILAPVQAPYELVPVFIRDVPFLGALIAGIIMLLASPPSIWTAVAYCLIITRRRLNAAITADPMQGWRH